MLINSTLVKALREAYSDVQIQQISSMISLPGNCNGSQTPGWPVTDMRKAPHRSSETKHDSAQTDHGIFLKASARDGCLWGGELPHVESGPIPHTAGGNVLRAVLAIRPPPLLWPAGKSDKELRDSGDEGVLGWPQLHLLAYYLKQQQHPASRSLQDHQGDRRGGQGGHLPWQS